MNKLTSTMIKEIINTIRDSKRFVLAQTPEICRQLIVEETIRLKYNLYECALLGIGLMIASISSISIAVFLGFGIEIIFFMLFILIPFFYGCVSTTFDQLSKLRRLKAAPKVFLLSTLMGWIKK